MRNELIVMTFKRAEDALKARQALEMMRGSQLFGLMDAIIITMDNTGQVAIYQQRVLPAHGRPSTRFLDLFVDVLFGSRPSEEGVQQLAGAGLDRIFLQEMVSALGPDSSALLIYVPHDSLVDTQRLMNALSLLRGQVHHTTIPAMLEQAILKKAGSE